MAHFDENISWLNQQHKYPYIVYTRSEKAARLNPDFRFLPLNVGAEATSYLTYIVEQYYHLPQVMAFIHGHHTSWHQSANTLRVLDGLDLSKITFKTLNDKLWNCYKQPGQGSCENGKKCGRELLVHDIAIIQEPLQYFLGLSKEEMPKYILSSCCAQFVVHRQVIHSKPLDYYKTILDKLYNRALKRTDLFKIEEKDKNYKSRIGYVFEYLFFKLITGADDECEYSL